jgi:hypothetical protein
MILLHSNVRNSSGESLISEEGNFIKREPNEVDMVSYLPKSKLDKIGPCKISLVDRLYSDGIGRIKIKIGRFASKFLSEKAIADYDICPKDVEQFVNLFKSYFNSDSSKLKIVEGKDILKYYLQENYHMVDGNCFGTIWNSCMRYRERNHHMQLYVDNTFIKMLVLFNGDKIQSRALLWDGVKDKEGKEYKIMDRIYTVFDHDVDLFKSWAKDNGYIPKYSQDAKSESFFDVDGKIEQIELTVELQKSEFEKYPYLDSFKFYDPDKKTLSNSPNFSYKYVLTNIDGGVEPPRRQEIFLEDSQILPQIRRRRMTISVDTATANINTSVNITQSDATTTNTDTQNIMIDTLPTDATTIEPMTEANTVRYDTWTTGTALLDYFNDRATAATTTDNNNSIY